MSCASELPWLPLLVTARASAGRVMHGGYPAVTEPPAWPLPQADWCQAGCRGLPGVQCCVCGALCCDCPCDEGMMACDWPQASCSSLNAQALQTASCACRSSCRRVADDDCWCAAVTAAACWRWQWYRVVAAWCTRQQKADTVKEVRGQHEVPCQLSANSSSGKASQGHAIMLLVNSLLLQAIKIESWCLQSGENSPRYGSTASGDHAGDGDVAIGEQS